jgi:O-acetylhomoserine (thiol)-lyase
MTRDITTRSSHADRLGRREHGAILKPAAHRHALRLATAEELTAVFHRAASGHVYGRQGNPTTAALETKISLLKAPWARFASPPAWRPSASTMMALLQNGDHVVASRFLFGNTASWMNTLRNSAAK